MTHSILPSGVQSAIATAALVLLQAVSPAASATVTQVKVSGPQARLFGDADGLKVNLNVVQHTTQSHGRPVTQTRLYYALEWCDIGPWPMAAVTEPVPPSEPPNAPCRTFASGYGNIPHGSFVVAKNGSWHLNVVPASVPGFHFEGSGELISLTWTANGERQTRFKGMQRSSFGNKTLKQKGRWTEQSADATGTVFGFALRPDAEATMGYVREMEITIEK